MASPPRIKSTTYLWQGVDARGRPAKGEIGGGSAALVKAQLRRQGIKVSRVRRQPKALFQTGRQKIRPQDVAVFTRQLATMVKAGIPLVQSFDIVAESLDNVSMRELVAAVRDDVASGNGLANSLRRHPRQFDALYCNLVEAGEHSGALDTMLERVAQYKEKSEALKSRIRKAMYYPLTVICVAIAVTGIMLVKVVPQFDSTFASFGVELPLATRYVMRLSDFASASWLWMLLGAGFCGFLCREARRRSAAFAHLLERLSLRLPIVGAILRKSVLARFTRTLSTTFAAGVPLVEALDAVAGATGNVVYRQATQRIRDDVTTGQTLAHAIRSTRLFPPMVIQMVSIGEESGALDGMLDKCAAHYEAEVDNAVDGLTSVMEPLIIAVLGLLIGGVLIAMYLPIFQLGSVL